MWNSFGRRILHKKRGFLLCAAATVLALSIVLSGCGLENIPYYDPPIFSYDGTILTLRDNGNVSADDSSFKGYEVFYRVYTSSGTAESIQETLTTYAASVTDGDMEPDTFMTYAENLGFVRMRRGSDSSAPLIAPTDTSNYYIQLPQDQDWYIWQDGVSAQTAVARTISSTSRLSFYKASNYNSGDADFAGTATPSTGTTLYFVFFAAGYWINTEDLTANYGAPEVADFVSYTPGA